jgi:hypothetical protein
MSHYKVLHAYLTSVKYHSNGINNANDGRDYIAPNGKEMNSE